MVQPPNKGHLFLPPYEFLWVSSHDSGYVPGMCICYQTFPFNIMFDKKSLLLAAKWDQPYTATVNWLRCHLSLDHQFKPWEELVPLQARPQKHQPSHCQRITDHCMVTDHWSTNIEHWIYFLSNVYVYPINKGHLRIVDKPPAPTCPLFGGSTVYGLWPSGRPAF